MCGALAIRPPSASKTAQEKSSRSLMLTECAVACRRTPICSATDMNRLLKISSMHRVGVACPISVVAGRAVTRDSSRSPRSLTTARQPGSTTVVARSSVITAGPSTACPGRSSVRANRSTWAQAPPVNMATRAPLAGRSFSCAERGGRSASRPASCLAAVTSTETASTMTGLSRERKEKRRAYSASNAAVICSSGPSGTMTAVSVPW